MGSGKEVYVMLADGFEEIEGLTVVDLLRRAGITVSTVSIYGSREAEADRYVIKGARGITVLSDEYIGEDSDLKDFMDGKLVVLPGGMPGTINLKEDKKVRKLTTAYFNESTSGKYVAAICAAPTVLADLGILEGKKATCYPGMEGQLSGATFAGEEDTVVVDGNVITSRGLGTAIDFSLKIIEILRDKETADKIATSVVYKEK